MVRLLRLLTKESHPAEEERQIQNRNNITDLKQENVRDVKEHIEESGMSIKGQVGCGGKERAYHRVKFASRINELEFTEMKIEWGFHGKGWARMQRCRKAF